MLLVSRVSRIWYFIRPGNFWSIVNFFRPRSARYRSSSERNVLGCKGCIEKVPQWQAPESVQNNSQTEELGTNIVFDRYCNSFYWGTLSFVDCSFHRIICTVEPESWSAAAMYQGARIFASNLKEKMAQRFYNLVLLPRIRDDIGEYKRLNFHLYQALRRALYKPGAFMKGIVIPLCEVSLHSDP